MHEQVEKLKENKSIAITNSVAQKKNDTRQFFRDNRPESIRQSKLLKIANTNKKKNPIQRFPKVKGEKVRKPTQYTSSPEPVDENTFDRYHNTTREFKAIVKIAESMGTKDESVSFSLGEKGAFTFRFHINLKEKIIPKLEGIQKLHWESAYPYAKQMTPIINIFKKVTTFVNHKAEIEGIKEAMKELAYSSVIIRYKVNKPRIDNCIIRLNEGLFYTQHVLLKKLEELKIYVEQKNREEINKNKRIKSSKHSNIHLTKDEKEFPYTLLNRPLSPKSRKKRNRGMGTLFGLIPH